ncbi:MAG: hypothetical protein JSU63_19235 [Phycisphaerales bacterium]|nr:MAG: hypothetical protein JSU63_19235 [Phycisphaerales bacterium]
MFERRLKVFLYVLGAAVLVIVGRLVELQIVRGEFYRAAADRTLVLKPKQLPFVRGSILDRTGEVLVSDEPGWDIKVDYAIIEADAGDGPQAVEQAVKRWRRRYAGVGADTDRRQALRADIASMWATIATQFSEHVPYDADAGRTSIEGLRKRAREIYERVQRIREAVAERRGFDALVLEETIPHAIVTGLDAQARINARDLLRDYPWVHVEPGAKRTFHGDAEPFAHLLGRLGRVDADVVANDPNADNPFAKYQADELSGISGIEYAAEGLLRGRRGQITLDKQGHVVESAIDAEDGRDVTLTIHADLQYRLYRRLGQTVNGVPESSGGAIVVLDIPTREVLALVSYPSYDPGRFDQLYALLRDDVDHLPLCFRAVANRYAPGSTVKPLVCLAGLMNGVITLDSREECTGYLFDNQQPPRCWAIHGTDQRMAHGYVNVIEALTGSCNIFMYRLGERLGVDGLCSAFDMFGLGRRTGTDLPEEVAGINPTPGWLLRHKNTPVTPGHARNFAIGQGELSATPLQVANLMATYASGRFRFVTLIRRDTPAPQWTIPLSPEHLSAIKEGIYGVVNDPTGTAYKYARFENDHYVICGKTGSATAYPWPTSYRIPYTDTIGAEAVAVVRVGAKTWATDRFSAEHPEATFDPAAVQVATRWPTHPPPEGENFSHAWFGGYLQAVDGSGLPDRTREPQIAFAVLVEFGGSGGRTSGPLARAVASELLEVFGSELDVNMPALMDEYP